MKIKRREFFFYISFILLYVSLFMGDVYDDGTLSGMARVFRLVSYGIIVLQFINLNFKLKGLLQFVAIFVLTAIYGLLTKDLYWSILVFFIYGAKMIRHNEILKVSTVLLIVGSLCVLVLFFSGWLPDVMTARDPSIKNSFTRHSLGFYHSNVLPLIMLYLEIYYVFIKKEKIKYPMIIFFMVCSIILYFLCDSRNAIYLSVILSFFVVFEGFIGTPQKLRKIMYYVTKYSILVMSLFSVAMMFLLLRGGIWNSIDAFFSGRFRLAIFKMRRVGLHLINFMKNEDFLSDSVTYVNGVLLDNVVLDNGYLYVILRYGLLSILFYYVISFRLAKKTKDNMYELFGLLVVFVANFIDNDLVDYSFLPFILYAFEPNSIQEKLEKREKTALEDLSCQL